MPSGWTRKRGSTWTWYIEDMPDPSTGRPRQVSKGGFRTRKQARDALLEAQAALRSGTFVEPSKRTVASYLLEEWLPENQPPRLRPSSYANYTIYTRTHVAPRLGDIELQRLTPSNLSGFYRALLTDARRDGQGLAPKTVRNIHAMLHPGPSVSMRQQRSRRRMIRLPADEGQLRTMLAQGLLDEGTPSNSSVSCRPAKPPTWNLQRTSASSRSTAGCSSSESTRGTQPPHRP